MIVCFLLRTQKFSDSLVLTPVGQRAILGELAVRIRAEHTGCSLAAELPELPVRLPKLALFTHSEKLQDVANSC